jgi:hypothetical protein
MMDLDAIAARYEERFGPIVSRMPVADRLRVVRREVRTIDLLFERMRDEMALPPAFERLLLWGPADAGGRPAVFASLGAVHRAPRGEVFITAKVPLPGLEAVFEHVLAPRSSPLAALDVLSCPSCWVSEEMPFGGFLLAPPEDGSFALGEDGGVTRYAFRAIALTPAEVALAKDAPEKALARLRAAGALVADPLRDCLVEPDRARAQRWSLVRALTRRCGRRVFRHTRSLRSLRGASEDFEFMIALTGLQLAEARAVLRHVDTAGRLSERHLPYAIERGAPPDAGRILRRAMSLVALAERAWLDGATGPDREVRRQQLLAWVEASDLRRELEPQEVAVLDRPIGRLSDPEVEWAVDSVEGLGVLGWALCLAGPPSDDDMSSAAPLFKVLGFPKRPPPVAETRATSERTAYLERVFTLLWRIEVQYDEPGPMDMREAAQDEGLWFGTLALEGLPLEGGDVILGGRPVWAATPDTVLRWHGVMRARLRAASWLAGVHPLYAHAPADAW